MALKLSGARTSTRKSPLYGRRAEKPTSTSENITKKTANLVLFWLVAGIEIGKDLLDFVWAGLEALGVGLTATVVGAVVGIPLSVLAIGMSWITSLTVFVISMTYFIYTKQSIILRLVIMSISTIIGMIPGLNLLPEATIGFFVGAFISTIVKVGKKVVGGVAGVVVGGAKKLIT